jgi:arsenite methyltransferase
MTGMPPINCARQTPEEIRNWCAERGLKVKREVNENGGITIIARKGN